MSAGSDLAVVFGAPLKLGFSSVSSSSAHYMRKSLCCKLQQSNHFFFPTVSMRLRPKRTCSGVECFGGYHINRLFHLFLFFRGSGINLENEDKMVDVLPVDKNVSEKKLADSGDTGLVDDELMALAQMGVEMDLAFELDSFMEYDDFGPPLEEFLGEFDDLPICRFDYVDHPTTLPDFDFEACNEALAWIDEVTTPMNGAPPMMNGAPLNIACP